MANNSRTMAEKLEDLAKLCEEDDCPLSEWAQTFVGDNKDRNPRHFSEKQNEIIDDLHERHCQ